MHKKVLTQDQITLIWNERKDQLEWLRHNETQRSHFTNILLVISGALLAFLPKDRSLTAIDWPIPAFLCGVGIFGVLMVMKYWERFMHHSEIERKYRDVLDRCFAPTDDECKEGPFLLIETRQAGKAVHESNRFPLLKNRIVMQHWLWLALFAGIAAIGFTLLCKSLST